MAWLAFNKLAVAALNAAEDCSAVLTFWPSAAVSTESIDVVLSSTEVSRCPGSAAA